MPTCQKKDQLCRCIDWPDEDFDVEIDHFIRKCEFLHVELEYASLAGTGRFRVVVPSVVPVADPAVSKQWLAVPVGGHLMELCCGDGSGGTER